MTSPHCLWACLGSCSPIYRRHKKGSIITPACSDTITDAEVASFGALCPAGVLADLPPTQVTFTIVSLVTSYNQIPSVLPQDVTIQIQEDVSRISAQKNSTAKKLYISASVRSHAAHFFDTMTVSDLILVAGLKRTVGIAYLQKLLGLTTSAGAKISTSSGMAQAGSRGWALNWVGHSRTSSSASHESSFSHLDHIHHAMKGSAKISTSSGMVQARSRGWALNWVGHSRTSSSASHESSFSHLDHIHHAMKGSAKISTSSGMVQAGSTNGDWCDGAKYHERTAGYKCKATGMMPKRVLAFGEQPAPSVITQSLICCF